MPLMSIDDEGLTKGLLSTSHALALTGRGLPDLDYSIPRLIGRTAVLFADPFYGSGLGRHVLVASIASIDWSIDLSSPQPWSFDVYLSRGPVSYISPLSLKQGTRWQAHDLRGHALARCTLYLPPL